MKGFKDCLDEFGLSGKVGLLRGHLGRVNCMDIGGNDDILVTGSNDCFVNFWDCQKYVRKKLIGETESAVTALVLRDKGDEVISGHKSGEIIVYDACELRPKFTLFGHTLRITALIVYNNDMLISSSWDGSIRIWDLISRIQERILKNSFAFINTLCIHGALLISGSDNRCLSFWDLSSYENTQILTQSEVNCIALASKFSIIVSGHRSGEIIFWDLTEKTQLSIQKPHSNSVTSIKFLFNHFQFFSSSLDCTIKLWDIKKTSIIREYKIDFEITCMALSKYANNIYLGSSNNQVAVMNYTENYELVKFFNGHTCVVHKCIWISKDECLITASFDGSVRIWDLKNDRELYRLIKGNFKVLDIATNDTRTLLAAGCSNKTIYIWDLATLELTNQVIYNINQNEILSIDNHQVLSITTNTITHSKYPLNQIQELYTDEKNQIKSYSLLKQYLVISINTTQIVILKLPK